MGLVRTYFPWWKLKLLHNQEVSYKTEWLNMVTIEFWQLRWQIVAQNTDFNSMLLKSFFFCKAQVELLYSQ